MSIAIVCLHCGKTLKAPDRLAGKRARCSRCASPISIPQREVESVADSPQEEDSVFALPPAAPAVRRRRISYFPDVMVALFVVLIGCLVFAGAACGAWFLYIVLFTPGAGPFRAAIDAGTDAAAKTADNTPVVVMEASAFKDEFRKNSAAWAKKYEGRLVEIYAESHRVELHNRWIIGGTGNSDVLELRGEELFASSCDCWDIPFDKLAKLPNKGTVRVRGTAHGNIGVHLTDCVLVSPKIGGK